MQPDVGWMYGGVASDFHMAVGWLSEPEQRRQHCLMSWSMVVIGIMLTYIWFCQGCVSPPDIHLLSRYITVWDEFYQGSPVLVLQVINAGVKRPGYVCMYVQVYWNSEAGKGS